MMVFVKKTRPSSQYPVRPLVPFRASVSCQDSTVKVEFRRCLLLLPLNAVAPSITIESWTCLYTSSNSENDEIMQYEADFSDESKMDAGGASCTSIDKAVTTIFLDQPPCCLAFSPERPALFVVGSYTYIEPNTPTCDTHVDADGEIEGTFDKHPLKVVPKPSPADTPQESSSTRQDPVAAEDAAHDGHSSGHARDVEFGPSSNCVSASMPAPPSPSEAEDFSGGEAPTGRTTSTEGTRTGSLILYEISGYTM